jgi:NADPH2:quinone reductase
VTEFKTSDRVYTAGSISGTYAEFALCKADKFIRYRQVFVRARCGSLGTPYATAYRGLLQRADAKRAKQCWCTARAAASDCCVQLARAHGLRVLGTAGSDDGIKLAREQGAHEVFDHRAPDHFEQIMKATGGHGVDVIVEMLANVNLGKDLTVLRKGGRVVIIGVAAQWRSIRATRCSAMPMCAG